MSSKINKNIQIELYAQFIDAYVKAHSHEKPSIRHHNGQVEWTNLKSKQEFIKEKIEEYLQIYNQSFEIEQKSKINETTLKENITEEDEESNDFHTLNKGDDVQEIKKIYYGKKYKPLIDEDISIDDLRQTLSISGVQLEPLDENKRLPKQREAYKELNSINDRISLLIQLRQMGLSTSDNTKQFKQLMIDRKKTAYKLRRLQLKQRPANEYRTKQRKTIEDLYERKPELRPQLKKSIHINITPNNSKSATTSNEAVELPSNPNQTRVWFTSRDRIKPGLLSQ